VNQTIVTAGTPTAHVGVDTVVGDFGAYDRAILDFVFNRNPITGWTYGAARLPIEIPSSDAAVDAQFEDVPADSVLPTYSLGAGGNLPAN
jgi:beta-glucosidase